MLPAEITQVFKEIQWNEGFAFVALESGSAGCPITSLMAVLLTYNSHLSKKADLFPKISQTQDSKEYCKVIFPYEAQNDDELTIREGDVVTLISKDIPHPQLIKESACTKAADFLQEIILRLVHGHSLFSANFSFAESNNSGQFLDRICLLESALPNVLVLYSVEGLNRLCRQPLAQALILEQLQRLLSCRQADGGGQPLVSGVDLDTAASAQSICKVIWYYGAFCCGFVFNLHQLLLFSSSTETTGGRNSTGFFLVQ
ncbi:SH3 domain-containing kinase-binding protein 1 [Anas platyrhynchos]|uniref:SH3 domain-containing kinase-binding protein 1 n=1 Tax=Anas platyrhynchos TaxID=8839 RepID=R0J912_ANAPL|nr:SH3 domain-containing kinase-binding protein 1 [Anas platyrhynchos]